jgi:hypothetical protein
MVAFTITPAALEIVRASLARTSVANPVVYLIEVSSEIRGSRELASAIAEGRAETEIRELAEAERPKNVMNMPRRLVPAIYPRGQFPRRYIVTLHGSPFVVPPALAEKLDGCTVDVAQTGLCVKDASGRVVLPRF